MSNVIVKPKENKPPSGPPPGPMKPIKKES